MTAKSAKFSLDKVAGLKLMAQKRLAALSMRTSQPKLTDALLEKLTVSAQTDGTYYNVSLVAPECVERRPVAIVCIIDVSGSMSTVVGKAEGSKAFTRLDLVKHVLNVLITALNKEDYLGIVKFSDDTTNVMELCKMTDGNKDNARGLVKELKTLGGTETAPAIESAYDMISKGPQNYINSILLLTDGVDSSGEQHLRTCFDKIHKQRDVQFSTFGFSSDIWSHLLQELALKGGGIFGYIPDQTMIGTVFINFLANTLLTYDQGIYIDIDDNYEFVLNNHPNKIAINFGQTRNFLLRRKRQYPNAPPVLKIGKSVLKMMELQPVTVHEKIDLSKHLARNKLLQFCFDGRLPSVQAKQYEDSKELAKLSDFLAEFKQLNPDDMNQQQLKLSLSYWSTWGQHYVRSFVFAHLYEQCLNFKAPSMQIYRNPKFQIIVDELTDLFCNLDPPVPTGYYYASYDDDGSGGSSITMNNLMDPRGGCILESCRVKLDSGVWIPIGELRKGQVLSNGSKVVCLIKSLYRHPLVKIGKLALTPYHPINHDNKWQFPIDLLQNGTDSVSIMTPNEAVHVCNIVLDKTHFIEAEGIKCITLGHGLDEGVLKHPYYGTNAVINEMQKLKGWTEGLIKLKDYSVETDHTGLICSTKVFEYDD